MYLVYIVFIQIPVAAFTVVKHLEECTDKYAQKKIKRHWSKMLRLCQLLSPTFVVVCQGQKSGQKNAEVTAHSR